MVVIGLHEGKAHGDETDEPDKEKEALDKFERPAKEGREFHVSFCLGLCFCCHQYVYWILHPIDNKFSVSFN